MFFNPFLNVCQKYKDFILKIFAHNFCGFDSQFVLCWLMEQGISPSIIKQGLGVVSMNLQGIRILDSYKFLPLPLAKLPKAFGFEAVKGHFPHFFNRLENQNYVGTFPAKHFFGEQSHMTADKWEDIEKWYETNKDKTFDFRAELEKYCREDVNILRKSVLKFRELFISCNDVDPYQQCCTIASACMRVFRTKFLEEGIIGIVPNGGYRRKDRYSQIALNWLQWISESRNVNIRHARNGREHKIQCYKVDGFCEDNNKVYEFHGQSDFSLNSETNLKVPYSLVITPGALTISSA